MPMMHGYAMDKSGTVVNRDVPANDVEAYRAAGYKMGGVDGAPTAEEYGASKLQPAAVNDDAPSLSRMNKAELLAEAQRQGIPVSDEMTKAEIITAIEG